MPISSILKRATSYILGSEVEGNGDDGFNYEDNEILFCKNNVCVHPPALVREESDVQHYSGYLTLCTKTFIDQHNLTKRPTLFLTWIPNSTLRKCPAALENCSPLHHPKTAIALQRKNTLREEDESVLLCENQSNNNIQIQMVNTTNPFLDNYVDPEELATQHQQQQNQFNSSQPADSKSMNFSDYSETISISSSSDRVSVNDYCYTNSVVTLHNPPYIEDDEGIIDSVNEEQIHSNYDEQISKIEADDDEERELKAELEPLLDEEEQPERKVLARQISAPTAKIAAAHVLKNLKQHQSMTSVNITIANPQIENSELPQPSDISEDATTNQILRSMSIASTDENNPNWMTAEMYAYKHNLTFPDSVTASPVVNRKQTSVVPIKCRRFSVDLSQMRAVSLNTKSSIFITGDWIIWRKFYTNGIVSYTTSK
jgi:TBC1 domain family member 16